MISDQSIISVFTEQFRNEPAIIARAPGRINLIGEHVDYNGGFVLPAAINCEIKMAASPNDSPLFRLYSRNYAKSFEFDATADLTTHLDRMDWTSYFIAVVDQFRQRGLNVPGMDVAIDGDVPLGAGLSSSAAYEVCAGALLTAATDANIEGRELALLAQAAEHSPFVGVRCGIMDQFASVLGRADAALLIDCFSMAHKVVPFNSSEANIVVINSMKRRGLVDSEYNQRRQECEEGLNLIRRLAGEAYPSIRHIPAEVFAQHTGRLPEGSRKRLRHNLTENARVLLFVDALRASDWNAAGDLLYESHASLRNDFQVSCHELDRIVEIASDCDGVLGCRMTGAGFGGCAVALVRPDAVDLFSKRLSEQYQAEFGVKPDIYATPPTDGAQARYL